MAAAGPSWRLSAEPKDPAETALHDAASREGAQAVDALRAVARQYPEPAVSGLAHLAAGLRLVESHRNADALAELSNPDVQRTPLRDYAEEATGRAQEALGQLDAATASYLAAAAEPTSAVACTALPRAAELLMHGGHADKAVTVLARVVASCPRELPDALLALGEAYLAHGDRAGAAAVFDRLDRELPGSPQGNQAHAKLRALADQLPARTPEERARLALARGTALVKAGRTKEALDALRLVPLAALPAADADLARVSLAGVLLKKHRSREATALLQKIPPTSEHAAQAAFLLAQESARRTDSPDAFEAVADRYRGTPWAEEALLSIANHYQKDALDDAALPWWRRLLAEYPQGRYVDRAAFRCGWSDYRAGRFEAAARTFESAARLQPAGAATAGLLYWAGRARLGLGQTDRARELLHETVQRYANTYHGLRAREALLRLGEPDDGRAALLPDAAGGESPLPEPRATRAGQLLLIESLDQAAQELRAMPQSSKVEATLAWIEWRHGHLRAALVAMKRAYPEWISEAGDTLPNEVWRILYPIRYEDALRAAAEEESLDPALVAALILQESSFDAAALSRAGARGLMQVMPATGRRLARARGIRFKRASLHDPKTSLDFGAHYLRQMSDRFDGSIEKVLAAYNAGPHRVDAWTALRGERSVEEFIETIPFSETRAYVMIVLANREHYRRIYGLGRPAPGPVSEGARP